MKKFAVYSLLLAIILYGCDTSSKKDTATEVVKVPTATGNFGAPMEESNVKTVAEMFDVLQSEGQFEGKVIGEIKEVCVKKGCWMTLELPDGQMMRVTFKDYGFFVPTNSSGYPVILEGIANKNITDVETQRHYAEDAGKSKSEIEAIVLPKEEFAFEAVGVIIKENA